MAATAWATADMAWATAATAGMAWATAAMVRLWDGYGGYGTGYYGYGGYGMGYPYTNSVYAAPATGFGYSSAYVAPAAGAIIAPPAQGRYLGIDEEPVVDAGGRRA